MRKWLREWLGVDILEKMYIDNQERMQHLEARIELLKAKEFVETSELEAYKKEIKAILERQDKELLNMGLAYQALDSRVELLEKQIKECETKKHVDEYVN